MHPHHPQPTVTRAHHPPRQQRLIRKFLEHVHDSELWANYLPRIPRVLYLLALLAVFLLASAYFTAQNGQALFAVLSASLGVLLLLPVILIGAFVHWKRKYSAAVREHVLGAINWRGDEKVLDVGCGSGVLLNGVAGRLNAQGGQAVGIDLWTPRGGGGNLDLLRRNAAIENVADRIEFREADARKMPFASGAFDVVVSSRVGPCIISAAARPTFNRPYTRWSGF